MLIKSRTAAPPFSFCVSVVVVVGGVGGRGYPPPSSSVLVPLPVATEADFHGCEGAGAAAAGFHVSVSEDGREGGREGGGVVGEQEPDLCDSGES